MPLKLFAKTKTFALDINTHSIYLLGLTREKQKFSAHLACVKPLPLDVVVSRKIIDWQKLSILLKELVMFYKLGGAHVILHLPAMHLRMNIITLPLGLSDQLIEQEIQRHVAKEIPGLKESLIIDYAMMHKEDDRSAMYAYAVTKQAYVLQYRRLIAESGLKHSIIDVDVYALVRVLLASMSIHCFQSTNIFHAFIISQQTAYLIIFTVSHVIMHYQWEIQDDLQMQEQLQARLQTCMAALNKKISCLIIFADQHYHEAVIKICASLNITVTIEKPIPIFMNDEFNQYDFLIATGLALRML